MNIGSLFSGIGGLELGLEWSGLGETQWQVEKDPYCLAVLAKHWPQVTRHDDVRKVGAHNLAPVDLVCGGFPCQDVSSAGKRAGLTGSQSGLWFEFARVVSELRPAWVVVENVTSGARAWVDAVTVGLERLGYACLSVPLAASDVGAPHRRARVFIVAAHANAKSQSSVSEHAEVASSPAAPDAHETVIRNEQGRSSRPGRTAREAVTAIHGSDAATDSDSQGLQGTRTGETGRRRPTEAHWRSPQPEMVRVVSRLPRRLDSPSRRIAALGNSVVPQCAQVIGHLIQELAA